MTIPLNEPIVAVKNRSMSDPQTWQQALLNDLSAGLKEQKEVRALVLTGSLADDTLTPDEWSDIDLTAIVADDAFADLSSKTSWLERYGEVLGLERHLKPEATTLRICLTPCRRVDISLIPESFLRKLALPKDAAAPRAHVLLWSKMPEIGNTLYALLPEPGFSGISRHLVAGIAEAFWFKAAMAVAKTVRNDLLIASHLALDLTRDCLVLQMMRRDRAFSTSIHREGGFGNDILSRLCPAVATSSAIAILKSVEQSSRIADELLADLMPSYTPRAAALSAALRRAELQCQIRLDMTREANQSLAAHDAQAGDVVVVAGRVLRLRPCKGIGDEQLIRDLTEENFRASFERTIGWDVARHAKQPEHPERYTMIMDEEATIGFVSIREQPDALYLETIQLQAPYRNKGYGTGLMAHIERIASASGKSHVRFRVFKDNPATRLYERLGFTVVEDQGWCFLMAKDLGRSERHAR